MDRNLPEFCRIESISRRPFASKRYRVQHSFQPPNGNHFSRFHFDIYRFQFRFIEEINLELAYQFRNLVEEAGREPFLKRQFKIEKALKKALNRDFTPLQVILEEIQLELGLDIDSPDSVFREGLIRLGLPEQAAFGLVAQSGANEDDYEEQQGPLDWMAKYDVVLEFEDEEIAKKKKKASLNENAYHHLDQFLYEEETETEPAKPEEKPAAKFNFPPLPVKQPEPEHELPEVVEEDEEPVVQHNFNSFKLPKPKPKHEEPEQDIIKTKDDTKNHKTGLDLFKAKTKELFSKKPASEHEPVDLGSAFLKSKAEEELNGEGDQAEVQSLTMDPVKAVLKIPPPLYKFKIELKKKFTNQPTEVQDPSSMLIISSDCIKRRTSVSQEENHFLNGTEYWDLFRQRSNTTPSQFDPNALVIDPFSIDYRTNNIKVEDKHALTGSGVDQETFKAFDALHPALLEKENVEEETIDSDEATSEVALRDKVLKSKEDKKQEYEKNRAELYKSSLDDLVSKNTTLYDYWAGKILIDKSDKLEIGQWVRAQRSTSAEFYRAYTEAVLHPNIYSIKWLQEFVESRLKPEDFPGDKVKGIFKQIREELKLKKMKRDDWLGILKRQDFLTDESIETDGKITYSRAYSRYRDWQSNLQSPKITVRTSNSALQPHTFPQESFTPRLQLINTPIIEVRTSSDYLKGEALPIYNKLFSWKKSQDTLPEFSEEKLL